MRPKPSRQGLFPHAPSAASSRTGKPPSPSPARPGGTIRRLFLPCKREAVSVFPAGRLRQSRHPSNGAKGIIRLEPPAMRPGRSARLTRSGKAASASAYPARPFCGLFPHRKPPSPPSQGRAAPSGGFSCPASGKRYPFSRPGGSGNPGTPQTAKRHHTIGTPPPCALSPPVRAFSRTVASASAFPARPFCGLFPHRQTAVPFPRKAGRHHPAAFPALQAGSGIRFPDRAAPAIPAPLKRQKGIIRLELPRHAP